MSKLRQTHFEQEDWNASKDFKSAIIKLEKEVKTWHLMSILPFLRDRSALLAYQQRAEVDWIYESMRSSKACDVFIFVESRNLNLYFFSFCRLENNSKCGQNYYNDICCWSRSFFSIQITNHLHNAKAKLGYTADLIEFAANSESWIFSSKLNEIQLVRKC